MKHPLLTAVEINPPQNAKASVIFLHGLGASGHDLAGIASELHLPPELAIRFVFPHAPERPVTLNGNMRMPAWFDLYGLHENSPIDEVGIREILPMIHQLIEREILSGIPAARIVIAGFSQGGATALLAGLTYPQALAGIIGLSTFLSATTDLSKLMHVANKNTPIFLAHGQHDALLPLYLGELARDTLQRAGCHTTWKSYPIAHHINTEELFDIASWLKARLG